MLPFIVSCEVAFPNVAITQGSDAMLHGMQSSADDRTGYYKLTKASSVFLLNLLSLIWHKCALNTQAGQKTKIYIKEKISHFPNKKNNSHMNGVNCRQLIQNYSSFDPVRSPLLSSIIRCTGKGVQGIYVSVCLDR